jgi:D-hexose-6-phosphate mutarotase
MIRIRAWHGTNQAFDRFDPEKMGLANPNDASRTALFLALREDTAWAYADSTARKLVPDQAAHEVRIAALIGRAERASRRGDHDLSERLYLEAEEMETCALQAEPAGARVLLCEVALENPLQVDGTSRAVVTDLGAVLRAAHAAGHDAVIIRDISDTPAGALEPDDHIAVFDPALVRILEMRHAPEPDLEPEPDL